MLTEKPEHMTDEEWSAFNDDEWVKHQKQNTKMQK